MAGMLLVRWEGQADIDRTAASLDRLWRAASDGWARRAIISYACARDKRLGRRSSGGGYFDGRRSSAGLGQLRLSS